MGNELKLSLENFQSISQGELIFHTGTNAIVGQSNSGKSATFRALKACLANPSGSQRFIKKGAGSSTVTLEYNGNQIIWKRSNKESSYIINGETFLKTGSSSAFKIMGEEETGFVVDLNGTILNIEEELQLPFPFGLSKTDLFKLYENVFCISDSAIILKAAKKQEDDTSSNISLMTNELAKNKNKLEEIQKFKDEVDLAKLKKMKEFLVRKRDKLTLLNDGLPIIKLAIAVQDFQVDDLNIKNHLPEYLDYSSLKKTVSNLKELHNLLKGFNTDLEVTSVAEEYRDLIKFKKELRILTELEKFTVDYSEFENKLEEYENLKKYLRELKELYRNIKSKKEELADVEAKIADTEKALSEFKVCPLCLRPLD